MDLYEHEGKDILRNRGLDVPVGHVCHDISELEAVLGTISFPAMVKGQVLAGGRGKAGAVRKVEDAESALSEGRNILSMTVKGKPVVGLLVEPALEVEREIYVGLTYHQSSGGPLLMVASSGGVDVEIAAESDFHRQAIDPLYGLADYQIREAIRFLGEGPRSLRWSRLLRSLWDTFWDLDLELLEINPVLVTKQMDVVLADVKMRVNDDSVQRHPELGLDQDRERTVFERRARGLGLAGVELAGSVAVMANGAGLTMAVMDELETHGLTTGAFLDLGGTDDPDLIGQAVRLLQDRTALPHISGVIVCVFGGITRCDTVAEGLLLGRTADSPTPVVVRLRGIMESEGARLLTGSGIDAFTDIDEACRALASRMEGP